MKDNTIQFNVADFNPETQLFIKEKKQPEHIKAFEIGVSIYNRVKTANDMDFVKKEIDSLLNNVNTKVDGLTLVFTKLIETTVKDNFDPAIQTSYTKRLGDYLNTSAGTVKTEVNAMLGNVKEVLTSIQQNTADTDASTLGRARKMVQEVQAYIQSQFEGKDVNSYTYKLQAELKTTLENVNGSISKTIEERVRAEMTEALKPVLESITGVREEMAKQAGIAETMKLTSKKGFVFEEELMQQLEFIASTQSDQVEQTGLKKEVSNSQKGDFIYTTVLKQKIVIEAKDKPVMLKESTDYMRIAIQERTADYGILVAKSPELLQKQIGRWNNYKAERFIICCADDIEITIKSVKLYLEAIAMEKEGINAANILAGVKSLQMEIKNFAQIRTKLTAMEKAITTGADDIRLIMESTETNIKTQIKKLEDEIKQ